MMKIWQFRGSLQESLFPVWVDLVDDSELAAIGVDETDYAPVETRIVRVRDPRVQVVSIGNAHFVDDGARFGRTAAAWWVGEVRTSPNGATSDLTVTRYSYQTGLGYDIPSARSAQFGPPAAWTPVDAAGVPLQIVRARLVELKPDEAHDADDQGGDFSEFRLARQLGDTGNMTQRLPATLIPCDHRGRASASRPGALAMTFGFDGGLYSFWDASWVFTPSAATGPYTLHAGPTRGNPPVDYLPVGRGVDALVEEGDFFVIHAAPSGGQG